MTPYLPPSLRGFRAEHHVFSTWIPHTAFAYDLIHAVRPKLLVELGTHKGQSYFAFCQAMVAADVDGLTYAVDTWEGDAHTDAYGEEVFDTVNAINGAKYSHFSYLMRMRFDEGLAHFSDETVSLLHIDGFHTYDAVKDDFDSWFPKVAPGGIILMHDIRARMGDFGVWKFWDELEAQAPERGWECFAFDMGFGLGVIRKAGGDRSADDPLMAMLFQPEDGGKALRRLYAHIARYLNLDRQGGRAEERAAKFTAALLARDAKTAQAEADQAASG